MIRSTRFLPLALGAALAVSTIAASADVAQAGPRAKHAQQEKFQQRYGFTDQQMTAIREAHARQADQRREVGKALHRAERELRELALGGGSPADLEAKSAEVSGLMKQMVQLRAEMLREIAPVLTPEQREQLAKQSTHRHHRRGGPAPEQRS